MGVSPIFSTSKKQFGIFLCLEDQEMNFLGSLKLNMNIVYFNMNFFHFSKKFLPLLTTHTFFEFFTASHPLQPKWYFLLVFIGWYIELCK